MSFSLTFNLHIRKSGCKMATFGTWLFFYRHMLLLAKSFSSPVYLQLLEALVLAKHKTIFLELKLGIFPLNQNWF